MPEILATWPLSQQRPQDFTSRPSATSSTASAAMIAPQASGASALEEQGHEYKTVSIIIASSVRFACFIAHHNHCRISKEHSLKLCFLMCDLLLTLG